jgi:hypothetical protein
MAHAQTSIPVGSWRLHLSYNDIRHVEVTADKVFAATGSGLLVYDRQEKTLHTYNKLNGLSTTGITSLVYDPTNDQLIIGYADGTLDIMGENVITAFTRLKDSGITSAKNINHMTVRENLAYLSTAYGVVLFDLRQLQIKETWRDLGSGGEALAVFANTFLNDSIYIATAKGVLVGKLGDNLLDFNKWTRFDTGDFSGPVHAISTFNNKVYAAGPSGFYRYGDNRWEKETFLDTSFIESMAASQANLLMISDSSIWAMNSTHQLSEISDALIKAPAVAKQDETGSFWTGDHQAGLVSNTGGTYVSYLPQGPSLESAFRMVFDNGKLFVVSGGFSDSGQPLKIAGCVNVFENGMWTTLPQGISDLTDIEVADGSTFISSFGGGMSVTDISGSTAIHDGTNSPLVSASPQTSNVVALENSAHGLWVALYGGVKPLHLLKADGTWESFSFNFPNEQKPIDLAVDRNGDPWIVLNPASGGGLIAFDAAANQAHYITNVTDNGGLPDKNVWSLAADLEGYIWVGTGAGVAYFFSANDDAIKPIYESRFLLRDEKITAIEVDGGNRKWIGTEHGAWLFNPTGEVLLQHFTTENSPLLSGVIRDIEINSVNGEVFFATEAGIISFAGDATGAGPEFEGIKIFPNPVSPGYNGTVSISGLAANASVRITDISGRLIWQTQANGGMATWNVRDHEGRRAPTGIYLIFAATEDGRDSIVGKVAVIE